MVDDDKRREELRSLTEALAIDLADFALLDRALTHASATAEAAGAQANYESLEFVGDAVLGLAVAHCLYDRIPDRTPGEYSHMRARVVNRRTLAKVALHLGLAPVIRLGKGEEQSGGRQRKALLADCLEALIGALYLDRGWDAAKAFVVRVFEEELVRAQTSESVWDFKSRLQNYCQGRHEALPEFEVIRSEGPDHRKEFEVEVRLGGMAVGTGRGLTKKEAEQNAAREALAHEGQLVG